MPLPRSLKRAPGLGAGRNLDSSSPFIVGTRSSPPSASIGKLTGSSQYEIVFLAMEERVVLHVDDDVEIARRAAGRSVLALAVQPQALAGRDARQESSTVILRSRPMRPAPRQAWHGLLMICAACRGRSSRDARR